MEERAALLARVSADHGTEIKDPATGEVIGRVAFGTPGDVAAAVDTAAKAQPGQALQAFMRRRMPRVVLVVRNSMQLVRWEMGLEPHTEADVARTMSATVGFLAAAEA